MLLSALKANKPQSQTDLHFQFFLKKVQQTTKPNKFCLQSYENSKDQLSL